MTTYRDSGVDIDAGDEFVDRIKPLVRSTFRPEVLTDLGGFGGLFRLQAKKYEDPVLVSGTDGVGTKLRVAFLMDRHDTIGIDLVAMCVNDIAVSGAEPLFFLDYFATGKLSVPKAQEVLKGIAEGCRQAGCALIGGETAEMPSMYGNGEYDLAGFAVGVVDRPKIIDGRSIAPGDVIVGLASSGLHSNGYSLARRVLFEQAKLTVTSRVPELTIYRRRGPAGSDQNLCQADTGAYSGASHQGHRAHYGRRDHRKSAARLPVRRAGAYPSGSLGRAADLLVDQPARFRRA